LIILSEYFERTILCNSLVWTCSLSGKSGLTYSEALQSEEKAIQSLKSFPRLLEKVIVYLASLTKRGK
jgi:bromodomain adjacent to zinc finger domain protein 1A